MESEQGASGTNVKSQRINCMWCKRFLFTSHIDPAEVEVRCRGCSKNIVVEVREGEVHFRVVE